MCVCVLGKVTAQRPGHGLAERFKIGALARGGGEEDVCVCVCVG